MSFGYFVWCPVLSKAGAIGLIDGENFAHSLHFTVRQRLRSRPLRSSQCQKCRVESGGLAAVELRGALRLRVVVQVRAERSTEA